MTCEIARGQLKHVETTGYKHGLSKFAAELYTLQPATGELCEPAEEELEDLALVKACNQVPATTLKK